MISILDFIVFSFINKVVEFFVKYAFEILVTRFRETKAFQKMKLIEHLCLLVRVNVYHFTIIAYYYLKATFHNIILTLHSLEASKSYRKVYFVTTIKEAILGCQCHSASTWIFDHGRNFIINILLWWHSHQIIRSMCLKYLCRWFLLLWFCTLTDLFKVSLK